MSVNAGIYDNSDSMEFFEREYILNHNFYYDVIIMKLRVGSAIVMEEIRSIIPDASYKGAYGAFHLFNDKDYLTVNFDVSVYRGGDYRYDPYMEDNIEDVMSGKTLAEYRFIIRSEDQDRLMKIGDTIRNKMDKFRSNSIVWSFMTSNGSLSRNQIFLEKQEPLTKDLYPWIKDESVQAYFKRYLNSNECILLLTGIPGTGKTTFIRNLISENNLNAELTYDERLITGDEYFLDFIRSQYSDILIIEDADSMIYDRGKSGEKLLNKLLNISDGIIKNATKKIVFSTNITEIDDIDPALIRPGRCFDVLNFRRLTSDEANIVVNNRNLDIEIEDGRDYTLAELFTTNGRKQSEKERFGFR